MNTDVVTQNPRPVQYKRVVLASRPTDRPRQENFRLEEVLVPAVSEGQVLVRNRFLSIDPYMLGRMYETFSYASCQPLNEPMVGEGAGYVVESNHVEFKVGDAVVSPTGWQEFALLDGQALRKVDTSKASLSAYLGVLGMTGMTAWFGTTQICKPCAGETVVVSAAAGAVGGVAVQLAKSLGCRVIAIAGGADKCRYVTEELGADACVDYRTVDSNDALTSRLAELTGSGVDVFFDNVNGWVLDSVLPVMSLHGRIALCGMISRFGDKPTTLSAHRYMLLSRLKAQGFIIWDHVNQWDEAVKTLLQLLDSGSLLLKESISTGIESAPDACLGLLEGRNIGKQIVQLY